MSRWRPGIPTPSPGRWRAFRVLFYGLFAVDQLRLLSTAWAYGEYGFNVAHVPLLDGLVLPAGVVAAARVVTAAAAVAIAANRAPRWLSWALAGCFLSVYLSSQLDSFQHHYLLGVLLVILAPVDWRAGPPPRWVVGLFTAQLTIVYGWSVVAKIDPAWLDGSLPRAFLGGLVQQLVDAVAAGQPDTAEALWRVVAWGALVAELVCAVAIWIPGLRTLAWATGTGFHLATLFAGLAIGLFAPYMLVVWWLFAPGSGPRRSGGSAAHVRR